MAQISYANIVWLRDDLRLADNAALIAAITAAKKARGKTAIIYILEEESIENIANKKQVENLHPRPLGSATRWWLHHSLKSLSIDIDKLGGTLILRRGNPLDIILELICEINATEIFWNRRYNKAHNIDTAIKNKLISQGIQVSESQSNILHEPENLTTKTNTPFQKFTPYWKSCLALEEPRQPLPKPKLIPGIRTYTENLEEWKLLPTLPDWTGGLQQNWNPGEQGALDNLELFIYKKLDNYHKRDEPAQNVLSKLSPHLRFGEISPFTIWDTIRAIKFQNNSQQLNANIDKFLSELGWREFNITTLFFFPNMCTTNIRKEFNNFPWKKEYQTEFTAWKKGKTGVPLVDAGMRELLHTGTMHNRLRMITASFLTKNLLIDWREGESWFWDTLVDADEANNCANWQWVAGSGRDAAPYFRIFNPILQAKKFDPLEEYIKTWVPEYETNKYPKPIVNLKETRNTALAAYTLMRSI